jgi:putative Mg2+ transporter-C (MgtC) family protein
MFGLELQQLGEMLLKLGGAFLLALPVAWEREVRTRLMGLRTFPIVAMASCGYLLIANELFPSDDAQARVVQGLVAGMGFIGGGAILKRKGQVEGTATAASLWATGAVGMAVAYSRLDIAISISVIIFLTLRFLTPLEERIVEKDDRKVTSEEARGDQDDRHPDDPYHPHEPGPD